MKNQSLMKAKDLYLYNLKDLCIRFLRKNAEYVKLKFRGENIESGSYEAQSSVKFSNLLIFLR